MALETWGKHLVIDAKNSEHSLIKDMYYIRLFINDLVTEIDMVPYKEPLIERFALHDPEKAGISFCQMIETSHIAGHFCENTGDFYIDVFSCKDFDEEVVTEIVETWFCPEEVFFEVIERDANLIP